MTSKLRCAPEELPTLPAPWIWELRPSGWAVSTGTLADTICVDANLHGDEGIHIAAWCADPAQPAYAPLVVLLAVAMANGIDILQVANSVVRPTP